MKHVLAIPEREKTAVEKKFEEACAEATRKRILLIESCLKRACTRNLGWRLVRIEDHERDRGCGDSSTLYAILRKGWLWWKQEKRVFVAETDYRTGTTVGINS